MFEMSSRYGWWKTHAGWAERRDQALDERKRMIESYRATVNEARTRMRVDQRRSTFERRRALREQLVISDRYATRSQREAAPVAQTATFADYRDQLAEYYERTVCTAVDLDEALQMLREYESLLADLAFESDHTASDYIDPRTDDEIEGERESLSLYAEALEDVSAGAFDLAMEDRLYGRPSGYTNFIREAVADGWCCIPDFTDAHTNPVMIASDRGLLAAIDAEDHAVSRGKVRDIDAVRLYVKVRAHRQWLQDVILERDEADTGTVAGPLVTVNNTVPELRQAWLQAKAADDTESLAHIERWGRMLTH